MTSKRKLKRKAGRGCLPVPLMNWVHTMTTSCCCGDGGGGDRWPYPLDLLFDLTLTRRTDFSMPSTIMLLTPIVALSSESTLDDRSQLVQREQGQQPKGHAVKICGCRLRAFRRRAATS